VRKALGPTAIATTAGGYRLTLAGDDLDACRFEHLVERGRELASTGQPDRAATTLRRALELWRGDPFEDLDGWAAGRNEVVRLAELRRTVEEEILDARLAAGEHREVATEGAVRVAEEPLRECRWAILALAQYRCGRQADALRTIGRARRTLVDQLGVEPGPELEALEAAILHHDRGLGAPPDSAMVSGDCPYKGLVPYDVGDADSFFGRDLEVAECLGRLEHASVLVVAGPSGCGKSSLVRAGVVPRLIRAGHAVALFSPGVDPEGAMTTALAVVPGTPVLVVDQLEELFTIGGSSDAAGPFCRRLADYARDRAPVVVSIRADHLGQLSADATFARLVEDGLHLVRPLTGGDLSRAIEGPAAQAGLRLEHGLVDLLDRDLEGEPGALPLLSHALAETWRRRDGRVLTVEGYQATGGIRGAVARSAERLYEALPPDEQKALRAVLLRLVALLPEGEPVRSRASPRSLHGDPARDRVVDLLVRARLVTTDEDSVDLAHEALARAWPRLRGWLEESRTELRLAAQLRDAARSWVDFGRDDASLYRGARLVAALEAVDEGDIALDPAEREFLDASRAREEAELTKARAQLRRERRSVRRLRGLVAGVAVLAVAATGAGLVAVDQRSQARQEGRVATARELAAAAAANIEADPERSILLALEAVELSRSSDGSVLPEAEEALHTAVNASRIVLDVPGVGGNLDWSPDGSVFVTEGPEETGRVDIRDAGTGASVLSFPGHEVDVNNVAFNHDGSMLATAGDDGAARAWDPRTGEELWSFEAAGPPIVWGLSFSPDDSRLAVVWATAGIVRVYDLATGQTIREFPSGGARFARFSPDGERLALAGELQRTAAVVDARSGAPIFSLTGHRAGLLDVGWSPDGRWIATSSLDATARLWDARTGAERFALYGHSGDIEALDWSPDSTRLVTGSEDGTAKLWRITDAAAVQVLSLSAVYGNTVWGVAFSPDGNRVMTGDAVIAAVKIWDVSLAGDAEWAHVPAVPAFYGSAAFTPDGQHLVASSAGGSASVWEPETGDLVTTLRPSGSTPDTSADVFAIDRLLDRASGRDVRAIAPSPDGRSIATAGADGVTRLWDTATGAERWALSGEVYGLAWSPNGEFLATAGFQDDRGVVTVMDRDGAPVAELPEEPGGVVTSVAFSPDGRRLVTSRAPPRVETEFDGLMVWDWRSGEAVTPIKTQAVRAVFDPSGTRIASASGLDAVVDVWDARTGDELATLVGHTGLVLDVAFSPDGASVATGAMDGTVRLWDADGGSPPLVLRGHKGPVGSVEFSPDGSKLASVSADGTARVWALDVGDLVEIARGKLTRTLTDEECRQFLHVDRCP
jgi:WD40 repeat protein